MTFLTAALAALSLSSLAIGTSAMREQQAAQRGMAARYIADAGLGQAVSVLRAGGDANVGSANAPVEWGGGRFWVESANAGAGVLSLVCTGEQNGSAARLQLLLRRTTSSMWTHGAFGDEDMRLDSNAMVDSYDSTSTLNYAQQAAENGGEFAAANGPVGSNANVLVRQNARVYGDAHPGPTGTISVLGNAVVSGSTAPAPQRLEMPPLEIPDLPPIGPLTVPGNTTVVLPPGQHSFSDFRVHTRGDFVVTGPAVLVLDTFRMESNSTFVADTTLGPVEVYVRRDFVIRSNVSIAPSTREPKDLAFNLWTNNIADPDQFVILDELGFDSNSLMYGSMYAPRAHARVESNFELFGALVARRVTLDSNSRVHYDERLAAAREEEVAASYETLAWRILPLAGN